MKFLNKIEYRSCIIHTQLDFCPDLSNQNKHETHVKFLKFCSFHKFSDKNERDSQNKMEIRSYGRPIKS